ncbi:DUF2917 domain-containing protein [Paludibacterium purpuratum]|uniref:DUF2917 family protein n=1 Tax=Paludibacterium purpuratum TaxID=1144873 RepID=A0A4R7B117_9NEIS|nr:DUF2917 domain-containing protein [Paludibacterium purpuratum]TDR76579.1 DUF2917 family protein [Paludibacterium purpuratum]
MQTLLLTPSRLIWLSRHRGETILCRQGRVWLSHAGQDVILEAGQSWRFAPGERRALAQSLGGDVFLTQTAPGWRA